MTVCAANSLGQSPGSVCWCTTVHACGLVTRRATGGFFKKLLPLKYFLLILFAIMALASPAQSRVSIGFWNVENLFDTVRNPFTDDADFTPEGRYHWNTARYNTKIAHLARVLDAMDLDVVGLAEVENETVLRDLVRTCKTDYAYVRLTGNDRRGIGQALLYKGDKFFPDPRGARLAPSSAGRGFLHVKGKLAGQSVDLVVAHMPSNLNAADMRRRAMASLARLADSLLAAGGCPVVMGDMNAAPRDRIVRTAVGPPRWFNPTAQAVRRGMGSYAWNDRWLMYDQIIACTALTGGGRLRYDSCGVFVREWMLDPSGRRGYPLRTFSNGIYTAGYSDHLPVYMYLNF